MKNRKFQIGDKVRCISLSDFWVEDARCKIGGVYEVIRVSMDGFGVYLKETDEREKIHSSYVLDSVCFIHHCKLSRDEHD